MKSIEGWCQRLLVLIRVTLGVVFIISGYSKLLSPVENFYAAIVSYAVVAEPVARLMAHVLPWVEFTMGVFLVIGLWQKLATLVLWALNCVFIFALGWAMARGLVLMDCGCMGKAMTLTPRQTFMMDIAMWNGFLFIFAYSSLSSAFSLDRHYEGN